MALPSRPALYDAVLRLRADEAMELTQAICKSLLRSCEDVY